MVGPLPPAVKKRKVLEHEHIYLDALPSAQMYERSYMHRDVVTHVLTAQEQDFIITGSADGHLKFWKKKGEGIEFAKHFRAHMEAVFDVLNFDMIAMLRLPFVPSCASWIFKRGEAAAKLAIADQDSPAVHIFDIRSGSEESLQQIRPHQSPVEHMQYNAAHDVVISVDCKGMIEYWSAQDYSFPEAEVSFKFKTETDLYVLAKSKVQALSLAISRDGQQFAMLCSDRRVRVFRFASGKLRASYDESIEAANDLQRSDTEQFKLDNIDFGRRLAVEKDITSPDSDAVQPNVVFDDSGNFLLYATLLGIKVVNLVTHRVSRIIGKVENTERFLRIALYQGVAKVGAKTTTRLPTNAESRGPKRDPTVVACAHGKHRLYLFSCREPEDSEQAAAGRDVFNEKPTTEDILLSGGSEAADGGGVSLPKSVVIHTTRGDIAIKLFPEQCPKTIENFTTHAKNGYYDNIIFHRVIKGFMLQTGDPLGDGTGGTSIWGHEFVDEFDRSLRHDRPFTVSMANAGPNTNGSQFFITTVPTPWLDGKHTVFGRVLKGSDVVLAIEKTKTNPKNDKPFDDIKIINIDVKD
eukprot:jgi/Astpho2/2139/fgenesh1_pm.00040_%23_3_t